MLLFYAAILFYATLAVGLVTVHLIRQRWTPPYPPTGQFSVAVITPCKGHTDPYFEDNLHRIIQQDYGGPARFIFVVEDECDPALPFLRALARQFEQVQLCIAGPATQCAQKVFNILQGMKGVNADIFLFADADINPHSTWLQEMVAPFQDPNIGAVTGSYRRVPVKAHFQWGDYLAGMVAAALDIFRSDDRFYALWGGSMALRQSIIKQYALDEYLSTAIVDDMVLMQALHRYRIQRRYVPSCTVKSYCDISVQVGVEWLERQFQYLQICANGLYWLFIMAFWPYIFLAIASPFVLIYGLVQQNLPAVIGSVSFWLLMMLQSWLISLSNYVNPASVPPTDQKYRLLRWWLATPAAVLITGWVLLKTALSVKQNLLTMNWRGIKYRVNVKTGQVVEISRPLP
ncbi:MAG: glycosyltransferase family 2 protein [Anaerolineae bacterium]|nr:glycosyltransferase family 2 protein [Anaerolineae bacterium]